MLATGVIERSISPYCNPLRVVKKKDGRVSLCLYARSLNDVVEGDNESPPIIHDILQKVYVAMYFTTLDLTHGYWEIQLEQQPRPYTAFLHDSHLYHFCRVPFGLKTAGSAFFWALSTAIDSELSTFVTYYIDDLLVASRTFDEHVNHLRQLFETLLKYNFTLRLSKAKFFQQSVAFLGFVLSKVGIVPDPTRLDNIVPFQEPRNKTELQSFLGIYGYYHQFSSNHAMFVDPFRQLLKKNSAWGWNDRYSEALKTLKENFVRVASCITWCLKKPSIYRLMRRIKVWGQYCFKLMIKPISV